MKKSAKIICVVLAVLLLAGGGFFAGRASIERQPDPVDITVSTQTFYATIKEIGDSWLLVEGLAVNDINHRGAFTLSIRENTQLMWRYTELLFEELKVGQNLAVTYDGLVLTSYPAQLPIVLRIELLNDSKELVASPEPEPVPDVVTVVDIVDRTKTEPLLTADALEGFWSDNDYTYYFSSIKSQYIIVHYSDGTQYPVREAMKRGDVTIADLDRFSIGYYKEPIVTVVDMACKEGVLDALSHFWSDEEYDYYFPNYDTQVTVRLSDGHSWPLHDALMAGVVTVSDLDDYGIRYYKEPKE